MPVNEPGIGPTWSERSELPGLASVLDPGDLLGAKNRLIDRVHKGALRSTLGSVRGRRVLDFGCGTGRLTEWLARRGAEVQGVDPSEQMIGAARRGHPSLSFEVATTPLPLADASFDAALTVLVLQYLVGDPVAFRTTVADIARVLRVGGRLVCIEQVHEGGALPWGGSARAYIDGLSAAGFAVDGATPVRRGSSTLIRLTERRPQVARLPLVPRFIRWEANRTADAPTGTDYVELAFVATKGRCTTD